jgi:Uma2 family endonuclease
LPITFHRRGLIMGTARVKKVQAPKLRRSSNGMLMTPEEFDAVNDWDDRYRYELIHGVLVVSPIPSKAERDPNEELGYLLRSYQEIHPQGSSLDATLGEEYLHFGDNRRRADRVIWAGLGRLPDTETDVPTIAVEFVSKRSRDRTRDYVEKRREYLALGVVEYWVIDRFRRTMTVFRKPPAEPAEQVFDASATYRTPLLPGFELPLSRLLSVADRWPGKRKRP